MAGEHLRGSLGEGGSLNELRPGLDDPAAAGLRTRKFLGTEEDNLPTKHTKHPKEEKPVLPVLVCFRVFGGQRSPLLRRLLDPESRIDQDHEQDAVIVDPKVAACSTDTHVAQMLGYLRKGWIWPFCLILRTRDWNGNAYCARENLANTTSLIFMPEPCLSVLSV